jgi:hypothetical protein
VVVSTAPPSTNPGLAYSPVIAYAGATDSLRMNPVPGAVYYYWTAAGNTNILFDGQQPPYQSTSPKVEVTFISPATQGVGLGNYHIQFFAGNACGTTNNNNVRIRATVEQPTSVSGNTVACAGQSRTFSVAPVVGAKNYSWSFGGGGGTITGNGGSTVTVTFTSVPAILCVHGVTANGTAGPDYCFNISTVTAAPGLITGNTSPCQGGSASYTIDPVAGAASYSWTTPGISGTSIVGSGTTVTVYYPAGEFAGQVCVTANSGCGESEPSCLAIVSGTIPPMGTITGTSAGVCSATSVNYQVPSTGATVYNWTVPFGATISSGQGTNSILVDFDGTFAGGSILLSSSNVCGLANGNFPVTGAPTLPIITGATSVCPDDGEGYVASSSGAVTYNWSLLDPDDGLIINTANPNEIIVQWINAGGTVSVIASNTCGNSSAGNLVVGSGNCRMAGNNSLVKSMNALVFPNPSQGRLTLQYNSADHSEYLMKITDMTGRIVQKESLSSLEGMNSHEIDLGSVSKGMYMLTLEKFNGESVIIRLVIE